MKTAILISAIAEWNAVKLMFPDTRIEYSPYGECFDASVGSHHLKFFHSGWEKLHRQEQSRM